MAVPSASAFITVLAVVGALTAVASAAATGPNPRAVAVVDGCGANDRWCLAYPSGCAASNTCSTVVTVRRDPTPGSDKFAFDMSATYTGYVAVALAQTTSMGTDSVVECLYDPVKKQVLAYQSVNLVRDPVTGKSGSPRLPPEEQKGVSLVAGKLEDGAISCSFLRDRVTTVNGTQYDLMAGAWVLQAAAGSRLGNDTSIKHHVEWVVSPEKVKLFQPSGLIAGSYGLRRGPPNTNAARSSATFPTAAILSAFIAHRVL